MRQTGEFVSFIDSEGDTYTGRVLKMNAKSKFYMVGYFCPTRRKFYTAWFKECDLCAASLDEIDAYMSEARAVNKVHERKRERETLYHTS
jgi:hypothetical protein